MTSETTIYGIDFSGSARPANDIWITEATAIDSELTITSLKPAGELFDASGRENILEAIRDWIRGQTNAVIGLDFPFGLPESTVEQATWEAFLETFATAFEGKSIDAFPGQFGEYDQYKRDIDYQYAGQSPLSPQIQYQVFYGLRDVLWPLVDAGDISVAPMHDPTTETPTVIETYPAATLGRLGQYRTGYKGTDPSHQQRRKANVAYLANERSDISVPDAVSSQAPDIDDAVDSLYAAVATWNALIDGLQREYRDVEGYMYV